MASKAKEAQTQTVVLNGTTYPLRYDYGSLVAFTDELGVTIDSIEEAISRLTMDRMSVLVWAGVMDWTYSGDDDDTGAANIPPARVAKWLKALSIEDAQAALAKAMVAFTAAMPKPAAKGAQDGPPAIPAKAEAAP